MGAATTLVAEEAESTGAAMAICGIVSGGIFVAVREETKLTSGYGEGGENELEEVHHLCGGLGEEVQAKGCQRRMFEGR